jgi:cell wall-associated NlpC family hydrolase
VNCAELAVATAAAAGWAAWGLPRSAARTPAPASTPASPAGGRGKILAYAGAQLGKRYRWGVTGPGAFDCSGLTMRACRAAGIPIPRTRPRTMAAGPCRN